MLSNPNQVEAVVWLLWVAFALVAISPVALLIRRPKRSPFSGIGPSGDQLAPVLKQLWSQHSAKPPPSLEQPLATV
jgi:hypothetical protein